MCWPCVCLSIHPSIHPSVTRRSSTSLRCKLHVCLCTDPASYGQVVSPGLLRLLRVWTLSWWKAVHGRRRQQSLLRRWLPSVNSTIVSSWQSTVMYTASQDARLGHQSPLWQFITDFPNTFYWQIHRETFHVTVIRAFSALTLLVRWQEGDPACKKTEWWGAGMVICLVQTCVWPSWYHWHLLSLASVKSRLFLPFWYRLTRVVLDKGSLKGCVCVI